MYVQAGGQENPIFHSYGAVGEGGDQQLVPAWEGGEAYGHSAVSMAPPLSLPSPTARSQKQHAPDSSPATLKSGFPKWDPSKYTWKKVPEHLSVSSASSF